MIHPSALIDPKARLGSNVSVGAFSIIGADVEIGAGTWIGPHVVINGPTRIGCDNKIYQFASLGEGPQDKKYAGEATILEIGERNVIREYCTMNRGTPRGGGLTRIGDDNWFMAYSHVAHDCHIGNQIVFANCASLAGHVTIGDYTILAGFAIVHQFCSIGEHCFCGGGSVIIKDVPPFMIVSGHSAKPRGINSEGLKRRGFSADSIRALREAYKVIYNSNLTLTKAIEQLKPTALKCPEIGRLVSFMEREGRGIIR